MIFFNFPKVFIFYIHFLIKINSILLGKIVDLIKEKKNGWTKFQFSFSSVYQKNEPTKERKKKSTILSQKKNNLI